MATTNQVDTLIRDIVKNTPDEKWHSIYQGVIEHCHDPLQADRVKVRVQHLHREEKDVPVENLPWAYVMKLGGGGHDYGQFMPLIPGSAVWVMFLNGEPDTPIILGTYSGIPAKRGFFGNSRPETISTEESDTTLRNWKAPEVTLSDGTTHGVSEFPCEMRQNTFNEPTKWIPFKTWKGASLVVEEKDARENLELLDRSGQGLRLSSRIRKDINEFNGLQRGLKSVFRGDQPDYKEHTDNRESSVSLRDLAQQGLHTEARKYGERVKVVSKSGDAFDKSHVDIDFGETYHSIDLEAGHKRTTIEGKSKGQVMFKMSFDSQKGVLNLEANSSMKFTSKKMIFDSPDITLKGDVLLDGDLLVSGDNTVVGETMTGSPNRDKPINYT